ncbi:MAG: nucleotidyl transferase AbiEii/AbiGii toxin family protein [Candidatus Melainabacteria bacterium]|nr:nucleotidyl transferase AbiEii/AbiGii toxin family protein [Candidatus Melainabacteria bacterium]
MLDINKHRTMLLQILKEIYSDTSLGPLLGFKGGTAAYLFYDLKRFSVDLDFDLLDSEKEELVFQKIEAIIKEYGEIKDKFLKRHTIFFLLSYAKGSQKIKVEINRRDFGSKYELKNYLGISMLVMIKEDMFAHKLCALSDRRELASRDIFDIWFFLKNNWDINETIIKKRKGLSLKEYIKQCIEIINKINEKYILQGIGELLDEKTKEWTRKNLKKDVVFLMRVKLES